MIERIEKMLEMYERGAINRRQFLSGLVVASAASAAPAQQSKATFLGRVINHVTLSVADEVMAQLQRQYPASKPSVSPQSGPGEKEVYLTDPDGIRLQLSAVNLKL